MERIENRLGLWVSMLVVPIFAFANAGVLIDTSAVNASVFGGVLLGLVVGKPVGIFLFSLAAVKLGIGRLPPGVSWSHLAGLGVVAGIGFTVALYVTGLSFVDPVLTSSAKLGVLAASTIAGTLGFLALRISAALSSPRSASGRSWRGEPRHLGRVRGQGVGGNPASCRRAPKLSGTCTFQPWAARAARVVTCSSTTPR